MTIRHISDVVVDSEETAKLYDRASSTRSGGYPLESPKSIERFVANRPGATTDPGALRAGTGQELTGANRNDCPNPVSGGGGRRTRGVRSISSTHSRDKSLREPLGSPFRSRSPVAHRTRRGLRRRRNQATG